MYYTARSNKQESTNLDAHSVLSMGEYDVSNENRETRFSNVPYPKSTVCFSLLVSILGVVKIVVLIIMITIDILG